MKSETQALESIKDYYGRVLKTNRDLKTGACCAGDSFAPSIREILKQIHPDVVAKFYGCGSPIPPELTGKTVLDLGSGSGRDCFILSKLVGPTGRAIGVDMTPEQLDTARRHVGYHMEKFGFARPNVEFLSGYIEDLESLGIANDSVDVVVSNCVINLSPDKERVFAEIFRVLKPGGELYFSDVFADRRIPPHLAEDPVLRGECLGGALYIEDFRRLLARVGCPDYRIVSNSKLALTDPAIERKTGMIGFHSLTVRAFKLDLEDRCEDYGQVAYYLGTVPEHSHRFMLDDHHVFETGRPQPVCGNTAAMLGRTRYAPHFNVIGDTRVHYGLFDCGPESAVGPENSSVPGGSCC
ncbi:MAG: methyltransferase type 11 [Candidatus Muproteobacteria bacterium RIFCSPHIGHO2_12_FULL_60_33]|uniref:Arsenite methyltransferase n=1 Tax=Candidatus Muproteobacteria bacterium RIFCSPLOWO2_01_FULL_60_18 TaxID=1817768 RepID=A0A1F6TZC0_9PROT|nr:MAG: methyltransferase type 11 [Candidatus Muproteobacteria bacterium RIFCSPLOWO2_01_FULL_60_18]OGI52407.1 MAG: methyltransferase type 11 [Candidatus Muproteobacteria bacterium RIFCSPHIGHO2_01_60_12]OGI54211.1 MAG: methyltransferase type 11 [Candidatus Muproteobacteria bacterium RIFCSPHIGHO2_12_FULL_60_33]OGI55320.1 MAG: methyltransferase type 11 [Candidatus Muproteobacteria bacterium RIFCSPHIGHO2_02_FULL_60_13]OGI59166.1 MAG: methyltransferase type 11 [Candidatus Muproteobacteria bacterium 